MPSGQDIEVERRGDAGGMLVVKCPSELTHEWAEPLVERVTAALPPDAYALILDCDDVVMLSSVGIAALLELDELCRDRTVAMRIAGLTGMPRQLLTMLKLEHRFTCDPTIDESVHQLGR